MAQVRLDLAGIDLSAVGTLLKYVLSDNDDENEIGELLEHDENETTMENDEESTVDVEEFLESEQNVDDDDSGNGTATMEIDDESTVDVEEFSKSEQNGDDDDSGNGTATMENAEESTVDVEEFSKSEQNGDDDDSGNGTKPRVTQEHKNFVEQRRRDAIAENFRILMSKILVAMDLPDLPITLEGTADKMPRDKILRNTKELLDILPMMIKHKEALLKKLEGEDAKVGEQSNGNEEMKRKSETVIPGGSSGGGGRKKRKTTF